MTKEKAIRLAVDMLLERAFQTSENYNMEKAARGFEREFAEAREAAEVLEGLVAPGRCKA